LKKLFFISLILLSLNFNLSVAAVPPVPNPVVDACYRSDGTLAVDCNGRVADIHYEDYYAGVKYDCICECGQQARANSCVPATSSSAGAGTTGNINSFNPQNDISGQAFLYRDWMTEINNWQTDNSKKWQSFEARALSQGYGSLLDFLNTSSTGMPYNDFVFKSTLSYLYKNLYRDDSKIPSASFYSDNPDKRPVRDDSKIPNASFYRGYDKKYMEEGIKNGKIKQGELPETLPSLKPNQVYVDAGGVFIGDGAVPMLLRTSDDEYAIMSKEQRDSYRINSILDTGNSIYLDNNHIDTLKPENPPFKLEIDEPIKELIETGTEPGIDYIKEQSLDKLLGEGAGKTILTGMSLYDLGKAIKNGEVLDAISEGADLAVGFLPEVPSAAGTWALTAGKMYGVVVKAAGAKVLDELKSAGFDLTEGENSYTYINKTINEVTKESAKDAWAKLKNAIFTPKELQ